MHKLIGFGVLVAIIEPALLIDPRIAPGQIEGALQYPPPSVGEDAQPPPPAGMVSQTISPRRIELSFSGSRAPPSTQRFIHPPIRCGPGRPPPTASAGG
jgi:hypothetical protein